MTDNVKTFPPSGTGREYAELGDLAEAVKDAIMKHAGRVPLAAVIGVLDIVADELKIEHRERQATD